MAPAGEGHVGEPVVPTAGLVRAEAEVAAPAFEQSMAAGPSGQAAKGPTVVEPSSPGGGLHDEGDPSVEEN